MLQIYGFYIASEPKSISLIGRVKGRKEDDLGQCNYVKFIGLLGMFMLLLESCKNAKMDNNSKGKRAENTHQRFGGNSNKC